jgi:hypothetical protein
VVAGQAVLGAGAIGSHRAPGGGRRGGGRLAIRRPPGERRGWRAACTSPEPELLAAVAKVHQEVAGLLAHPGAGGMSGDPAEMEAAAVLDHHEHIKGGAGDGVDVREVNREDRVGLGGEELLPGRPGPSRGGVDPAASRIFHGGGRRHGRRVRPARNGCGDSPTLSSPGPSAVPTP